MSTTMTSTIPRTESSEPKLASPSLSSISGDVSADRLVPGASLGRYVIVRLIGRGGMGCVYEAVHRDLGRRVAIKTLLPALAASPEARGRFLREGQAASRIRHPHVVDVTDVVAEGPTGYLVMEYLEGEDLATLIERRGALPLGEVADLLLPVVAAIAAAHELGVIHRDLKPENIFLTQGAYGGPCPKVVDFGISKVLGDATAMALTATSAVFGTMYYLPPEQLAGSRDADARGDQYALGAILYECVTGRRAFEGASIYAVLRSVAEGVYAPARSWRPELPPRFEAAIDRAMSLNPAARFATVGGLGAELVPHATAAVRALWGPVFDGAGAAERATCGRRVAATPVPEALPVARQPTARIGTGTMLLTAGGGEASRTGGAHREREAGDAGEGPASDEERGRGDEERGRGDEEWERGGDLMPARSRAPRVVLVALVIAIVAATAVASVMRRGARTPAAAVGGASGAASGALPGAASGAATQGYARETAPPLSRPPPHAASPAVLPSSPAPSLSSSLSSPQPSSAHLPRSRPARPFTGAPAPKISASRRHRRPVVGHPAADRTSPYDRLNVRATERTRIDSPAISWPVTSAPAAVPR